jgi:hypothetical protein
MDRRQGLIPTTPASTLNRACAFKLTSSRTARLKRQVTATIPQGWAAWSVEKFEVTHSMGN